MNKSEEYCKLLFNSQGIDPSSHNRLNTKFLPEERSFYQELRYVLVTIVRTRVLIGTKWSLTTGHYITIKNESKKINDRSKNKKTDRTTWI